MQLKEIRIRNFRTIEAEQSFPTTSGMTLVGPNSSGKTNVLKAIRMLFTGAGNQFSYASQADLTFGQKGRTSITGTFSGNIELPGDADIYGDIDELHSLHKTKRNSDEFNLTVYFTEADTPVYQIFPNTKRPSDSNENKRYSRIHTALINKIISSFHINYVPSAKSIPQLYEEFLAPFLRKKIANVLDGHKMEIVRELKNVADSINGQFKVAGVPLEASFAIPFDNIEKLLTSFDFKLKDTQDTPIYEKGMGIQALALQAGLGWVTEQQANGGKNVIWLLEEPESYLHPELVLSTVKMLRQLSTSSTVITTTHALGFVPQDPTMVRGINIGKTGATEIAAYRTYADATSKIRRSLGVKFGDFYNLGEFNVMLEGPTDREILRWFIESIPSIEYEWQFLRRAQLIDYGGVSHMAGFLRAAYPLIVVERPCVAVFDGDAAGDKARRDLQGYFGQVQVPFESGKNFVVVRDRFAIEGLFPDHWIVNLHAANSRWFEGFSLDAAQELMPFSVPDGHKSQVIDALKKMAEVEEDYSWAERLINVCSAINSALQWQSDYLNEEI